MNLQKEFFACLALKHTPYLGNRVVRQLFDAYPSAYEAVKDASAWPMRGIESQHMKRIMKNCVTEAWREKAEKEFKDVLTAGMDYITWFDPRFPPLLKQLPDPPVVLYTIGDLSLFQNPGVAVVGARKCTRLGLDAAGRIGTQLSKIGITVISGLALGIDRQAHLGGLQGIGSSIAVLGCGLDVDYPFDNMDVRKRLEANGLVVTEFGPGVGPRAHHFPFRNRIISGLSLGVLVAEAAHNSGSLITARLAGEQGKDVFALPGPIGQPTFTGCHRLIKQGACLVEDAQDIVEVLRYDFARALDGVPDPEPVKSDDQIDAKESRVKRGGDSDSKKKAAAEPEVATVPEEMTSRKREPAARRMELSLNDEEGAVMSALYEADKLHIDALGRMLEWDSAKVSKVLLMLEMRGAVQQLPGMWYLAREHMLFR